MSILLSGTKEQIEVHFNNQREAFKERSEIRLKALQSQIKHLELMRDLGLITAADFSQRKADAAVTAASDTVADAVRAMFPF